MEKRCYLSFVVKYLYSSHFTPSLPYISVFFQLLCALLHFSELFFAIVVIMYILLLYKVVSLVNVACRFLFS